MRLWGSTARALGAAGITLCLALGASGCVVDGVVGAEAAGEATLQPDGGPTSGGLPSAGTVSGTSDPLAPDAPSFLPPDAFEPEPTVEPEAVLDPLGDPDGDGLVNEREGTLGSNPLLADTDGDGLCDGAYDVIGECIAGEDLDGDGLVGEDETNPASWDSDGDTMSDFTETLEGTDWVDTDGDLIIDALDHDSDGDGVQDSREGVKDVDADGLGDWRDPDDDGDERPTREECVPFDPQEGESTLGMIFGEDVDGDGLPNRLDIDADGDGLLDQDEGTVDIDLDGIPDFLDRIHDDGPLGDPDGDGYSTAEELIIGTNPLDSADPDASFGLAGTTDPDADGADPSDVPEGGGEQGNDDEGSEEEPGASPESPPPGSEDDGGDKDSEAEEPANASESDGDRAMVPALETTDPNDADDDADGTPNSLDPDDTDGPQADYDSDGLDNLTESLLGTDPSDEDTDGDGLDDGIEVGDAWWNPPDSDGDGIIDALDAE